MKEKPVEKRIDSLDVKDVQYDQVRRDLSKPLRDDTEVSRTQVTTERVTVSRREITSAEEIDKPTHPKELDIGRIVIEEIPEEQEERSKRVVSRKEEIEPRSTEVTVTRRDVEEVPRRESREDVIKVGKLDVTDLEKTPMESRRVEERVTTSREKLDGPHKVYKTKF